MSLSKDECISISEATLKNAKSKFDDSELLAQNGSYGTGSSLLITSMEESIKSLILALDGTGFQFRSRAPRIKSLFNNHGLRYQFAIILSIVAVFEKDFQKLEVMIKSRFDFTSIALDSNRIMRWAKLKIHSIKKEIEWFEEIAYHRERGLYLDVNKELIDPESVTKREFKLIAQRVRGVISLVEFIHELSREDIVNKQLKEIQKQCFSEKWYKQIDQYIKEFNSSKVPNFDSFKEFIYEFEEIYDDPESIEFMEMQIKNWDDRIREIVDRSKAKKELN